MGWKPPSNNNAGDVTNPLGIEISKTEFLCMERFEGSEEVLERFVRAPGGSQGGMERFVGAAGVSQGARGGVPDDPDVIPGANFSQNVERYTLLKGS